MSKTHPSPAVHRGTPDWSGLCYRSSERMDRKRPPQPARSLRRAGYIRARFTNIPNKHTAIYFIHLIHNPMIRTVLTLSIRMHITLLTHQTNFPPKNSTTRRHIKRRILIKKPIRMPVKVRIHHRLHGPVLRSWQMVKVQRVPHPHICVFQ